MYVFIHGTLKQNEPNYYYLLQPENGRCMFVDKAHTLKKYPLIIASRYNIPFLLDAPGKGHNIEGELYDVDDQMLYSLDMIEEVPHMCTRRLEDIQVGQHVVQAWCFFLHSFHSDLLRSRCHANYSSSDVAHNMPYVSHHERDQTVDHRLEVKYFDMKTNNDCYQYC